MEIDIQKIKALDQVYLASLIDSKLETEWEKTKKEKFSSDINQDQINLIKEYWRLGFYKGIESGQILNQEISSTLKASL